MGQITNGDFETGDFTGWTVTGPHNADVIQHLGSFYAHIHINPGSAAGSSTPNKLYQMVTQEITIGGVNDSQEFVMEVSGANDSLRFDMEVSGSNWHDGGATWDVIIVQTGNPQSYNWNVANIPSEECKVKVVVFDACGNVAEDESDEVFTIFYQPPPVTYAVVIKQSTYNLPEWAAVAEALLNRYQGQLFIWNTVLSEVREDVALYHPTGSYTAIHIQGGI